MFKSFRNKVYFAFILILFIPILLLTIFDYNYVYNSTVDNIENYTKSNVKIAVQLIDSDLATFSGIVNSIATNDEIAKIMRTSQESTKYDFSETQKLYSIAQISMSGLPEKVPIHIVNKSKKSRYSTTNYFDPYYIDNRGNLFDAMDQNVFTNELAYQIHWRIDGKTQDISYVIGKSIFDHETQDIVGYVILDIYNTYFQNTFDFVATQKNGNILLLDSQGIIIADKENIYYPGYKFNSDGKMSLLDLEGTFETTMNGENYRAYYATSDHSHLKAIVLTPNSYFINSTLDNIKSHIIIFSILLILGAITIVYFTNTITNPVKKLDIAMNKVSEGDYCTSVEISGDDEFSRLGKSFNSMTSRIQQLIEEAYVHEMLLHTAEMKALKSQVNPHFLYNCLNSINMMLIVGEVSDVSKMTTALSKYYRNRVSTDTEIIPLSEELNQISNYLDIQMIRYKDKLSVTIEVDESLYNKKIQKLILLPLVENAIIHGTEQKIGEGEIIIRANELEDGFKIQIIDNGNGFGTSRKKGENTGIENTKLRLKYLYDSNYKFEIKREVPYTIVEIRIKESPTNPNALKTS